MKTFAERLKRAREAKYASASEFAELLGAAPHAYRKYERGEAEPNFETLTRICRILEISVAELLPEADAGIGDTKDSGGSPDAPMTRKRRTALRA